MVLSLLIVQHVLGLYLQLVPPVPGGLGIVSLVASDAVLATHVAVALLLLGTTGVVFFLAALSRRVVLWAPALVGLGITFVAFERGLEFIIGGQEVVFSLPMGLIFLGVIGSDLVVLFWVTRRGPVPKVVSRLVSRLRSTPTRRHPSRMRLARRARPFHQGRS